MTQSYLPAAAAFAAASAAFFTGHLALGCIANLAAITLLVLRRRRHA
jgi:hypothetical protein